MNRRKNYRKLSRRCKNRVLAGMLSAVLTLGVCVPEYGMPARAAELPESYGEDAGGIVQILDLQN